MYDAVKAWDRAQLEAIRCMSEKEKRRLWQEAADMVAETTERHRRERLKNERTQS